MSPRKKFSHLSPMKEKLAQIANNITTYKKQLKSLQKTFDDGKNDEFKEHIHGQLKVCNQTVLNLRSDYRHMHIAYSELRGVGRSKIEGKNTTAKALSEEQITNFKFQYCPPG